MTKTVENILGIYEKNRKTAKKGKDKKIEREK
jgi:hypothetical protein